MANTIRDAGRERFWRAVLKRHAGSGLSVRAFCLREKLGESNFYAWRRTIAQRDQQKVAARRHRQTAPSGRRNEKAKLPKAVPAFVPVTVHDGPGRDAGIVLELDGGRRLRFCESIEPDRLAAIVRAFDTEASS